MREGDWISVGRRGFLKGAAALFLAGAGGVAFLDWEQRVERSVSMMGTRARVTVLHPDRGKAEGAVEAAFRAMREVDRAMSRFREGSDMSRLNREGSVELGEGMQEVLEAALDLAEESGGGFDPAVGSRGSFRDVSLDGSIGSVRNGAELDLGGIGVGFAVDRAVDALRDRGVEHGLIDVGGDVAAVGDAEWRVGLKDPRAPSRLLGVVPLRDGALATSGNYERMHVLDPRTREAPHGLLSSTVVAERCLDADALSTAVFVLGREEGVELVERRGAGAVVVSPDGSVDSVGVELVSSPSGRV